MFNGALYASSYDGGHVYRFDGSAWTDLGQLGTDENTQTYSFAVYRGQLHVGTWRSGRVFRWDEAGRWIDAGRLGQELEVMGMLVHNGRLIAGTLPLAEVYEYRQGTDWRLQTRLDHTADVTYRRAWTMARVRRARVLQHFAQRTDLFSGHWSICHVATGVSAGLASRGCSSRAGRSYCCMSMAGK